MDFDALQQVALRVAGERSLDGVLRQIVDGLIERPGVAFARLWLLRPGDECGTCRRRDVCHNRSACLHLAASAGASLNGTAWSRVDGDFRRVPVGALKIGLIASRRGGVLIASPQSEMWDNPSSVRAEGIECFAGHPLAYQARKNDGRRWARRHGPGGLSQGLPVRPLLNPKKARGTCHSSPRPTARRSSTRTGAADSRWSSAMAGR